MGCCGQTGRFSGNRRKKFHIDQVIARIIRNRDVVGDEAIDEYLNGTLEHLHSPELLNGCREAADLLAKKDRTRRKNPDHWGL